MTPINVAYCNLINTVLTTGHELKTRNSVCKRTMCERVTIDRTPLVSVRKTAWRNCLREWEWFMSGSADICRLHPSAQHWWSPWADGEGMVANNYSQQFRSAIGGIAPPTGPIEIVKTDQIRDCIDTIKNHPNSRRNIITTWNPAEMRHPSTAITNCHNSLTQLFVTNNVLDMVTYQRSVDVICGLPHNWLQQWAFLMWLASRAGKEVGKLEWIGGDVHVYQAHYELAARMISADYSMDNPELVYTPTSDEFRADDFTLDREYVPTLTEKAEMIV